MFNLKQKTVSLEDDHCKDLQGLLSMQNIQVAML